MTVQTSLLENHLIEGDKTRFAAFRATVHRHLDPKEFFEAKLIEQQMNYDLFDYQSEQPLPSARIAAAEAARENTI